MAIISHIYNTVLYLEKVAIVNLKLVLLIIIVVHFEYTVLALMFCVTAGVAFCWFSYCQHHCIIFQERYTFQVSYFGATCDWSIHARAQLQSSNEQQVYIFIFTGQEPRYPIMPKNSTCIFTGI